jgi:hypothetical protein
MEYIFLFFWIQQGCSNLCVTSLNHHFYQFSSNVSGVAREQQRRWFNVQEGNGLLKKQLVTEAYGWEI